MTPEPWEYVVDEINTVATPLGVARNQRGAEGWELVSAYRQGPFLHAIFKRRAVDA
jgi:hypothetical protein